MMFKDCETNIVYIAEALERHWEVFAQIRGILTEHGITYKLINCSNIWIRDYMPIQVDDHHFVEFMYGANVEKYPQLKLPWEVAKFPFMKHLTLSGIYLDGGNCVAHGDKAIITDIIFKRNKLMNKKSVLGVLENLLEAQVIIIPHEPYDSLGHADGICKWIDDRKIFVADFDDKKYLEKLLAVLVKHNLEPVLFPHIYGKFPKITVKEFRKDNPEADEFNPAPGYYINFLHVGKVIIVPAFDREEDDKAVALLKKYFFDHEVAKVQCTNLSYEGGLINCVTWNIKR